MSSEPINEMTAQRVDERARELRGESPAALLERLAHARRERQRAQLLEAAALVVLREREAIQ